MKKILILIPVITAFLAMSAVFDQEKIKIDSLEKERTVEYKEKYQPQEVKAYKVHTLIPFLKEEVDVKTSGKVDTEKLGTYEVTYQAGDVKEVQKVIVQDTTKPKLEFADDPTYKSVMKATDNYDGDLTAKIQTEVKDGSVVYTVEDSNGNVTTKKREIKVQDSDKKDFEETSKTIYLTFDDGPSEYTDKLLTTLDKYNVKATFFTTSAYPDKVECMRKAAKSGHTVAVHTTTHNYSQIYSSDEAFWADHDNQNKVIAEMTGKPSTMFRFPGGSSNTISQNYSSGIMTRLVQQANDKGLQFYDWNVSSGDAGSATTSDLVFQNVIAGIQAANEKGQPSVVLQHDTKEYSVDAVERIILWGLDNGYEFRALHPDSFAPHHSVNN